MERVTIDVEDTIKELEEKYKDDPECRAIRLYYDIIVEILDTMDKQGVNQRELAKKMEVSEAWVSQFFNGYKNFRLSTIGKIEVALGIKLEVSKRQEKYEEAEYS